MVLRRNINGLTVKPRRLPFVLLGALLATTYFTYHVVFGTHGLLAKERLRDRSNGLDRELEILEAVRTRLRHDVAALRTEPPSPDVVEEMARATLGLIRPGDRVVVRDPQLAPLGVGGLPR